MTSYLRILLLICFFIPGIGNGQEVSSIVTPADLQIIHGQWQGRLTYVDYTSGNPFSMPAEASIEKGKSELGLVLNTTYPNEPKANNKSKISISKDGRSINKEKVISRKNEGSNILITTEYMGKDGNDNKKATIRHYYTFGEKNFIIRKEVKFDGEEEWILRNEFNYRRVNSDK